MYQGVEATKKTKVSQHLSEEVARAIGIRAHELGKTKSKYIEDLVLADIRQAEKDVYRVAGVYRQVKAKRDCKKGQLVGEDDVEA